ncbi:hypothetical protein [Microcoleus sp.]|uniref:hypothetical protein n=1 Tax=Microcoleus sp. TaxID=44472 RepID=UPI00403E7608
MPVPQRVNFLVAPTGRMPVPQKVNFLVGPTRRMPVPQTLNFLVGWASSPPKTILKNRQDACSTNIKFSCGVGF